MWSKESITYYKVNRLTVRDWTLSSIYRTSFLLFLAFLRLLVFVVCLVMVVGRIQVLDQSGVPGQEPTLEASLVFGTLSHSRRSALREFGENHAISSANPSFLRQLLSPRLPHSLLSLGGMPVWHYWREFILGLLWVWCEVELTSNQKAGTHGSIYYGDEKRVFLSPHLALWLKCKQKHLTLSQSQVS